jgi:magnesium transporter
MDVARRDFTKLLPEFTAQEALDHIRREGVGEKIVYFYVADADDRLKGVLPTRRLLAAPLHQRISELMISKVIAIAQTATVMDACDLFIMHKFLFYFSLAAFLL